MHSSSPVTQAQKILSSDELKQLEAEAMADTKARLIANNKKAALDLINRMMAQYSIKTTNTTEDYE